MVEIEWGAKYTKRTIQNKQSGEIIGHKERWSINHGEFYIEHFEEDGEDRDYEIGVKYGNQPPLHFESLQELENFIRFNARIVLDSVVAKIPHERRSKRTYLKR